MTQYNQIFDSKYTLIADGAEAVVNMEAACEASKLWGTVYYVVPLSNYNDTCMEYTIEWDDVAQEPLVSSRSIELTWPPQEDEPDYRGSCVIALWQAYLALALLLSAGVFALYGMWYFILGG